MPYVWLEIYVLFTMAILMFICSFVILYLGYKRETPNIILWVLFPFVRGLHWLIESIAEYYDEILDKEMIICDQLELITAFCSSFILLAACLEHNGMIKKPFGKIIILLISILPIYYLLTINEETLEEIEESVLMKWGEIKTDLFRFLYGFILPLIAIIFLIGTFFFYYFHTKKENIMFNSKVKDSTILLCVLIFIFSLFEGFDYYEESDIEVIFIGLRAISLSLLVIIPLIVIFSQKLSLEKFLIIKQSGLPLFQYDFINKTLISVEDDVAFLSSGFVSAIVSFSEQLAHKETGFLSIKSRYLYYAILKTKTNFYALQSILSNKKLENQLFKTVEEIDHFVSTIEVIKDKEIAQLKEILESHFSNFL